MLGTNRKMESVGRKQWLTLFAILIAVIDM